MKIQMGKREFDYPSEQFGELRDCNDLLDDSDALQERMAEDGYLLIRGLHDRQTVLDAGAVMFEELAQDGFIKPGTKATNGVINPDKAGGAFWGGRKSVSHHPKVLKVLEGKPIFDFFGRFFGEPALTFDYKWLRAVGQGGHTGAHYDVVYMGRGSQRLVTAWTPFVDVPIESGPLALCVGSHNLPGFEKVRETYGRMDVDRDHVQGWFSNDPVEIVERFGGKWHTTAFEAGDVLVLTMFTMHGSLNNISGRFRISSDTRFQPASEPADERWMGEKPIAHYGWNKPGENLTMDEARSKWGV